jgi:hypothetical protein
MSTTIPPSSDSDIFARVVSSNEALPPGVARAVLDWKFPEVDLKRVARLQKKNNLGGITESERRQLESYVRVGQFIAVMQAKAKLSLKKRGKA